MTRKRGKRMKKLACVILTAFLILGMFAACENKTAGAEDVKAAAVVNGEAITESDFESYVAYQKKVAEVTGYIAPEMWSQEIKDGKTYEEALKESVLEEMIKNVLIIQDAKKMNVSLSEEEVNLEIDNLKGSEDAKAEFDEQLEKLGIDETYLKDKILSPNLLINRYFEETVQVSDEEAQKYYEEFNLTFNRVRARHILVDSEDKARAIKQKLDEGGNFEELAKEYSTCPSKENGGDLGYFTMGQMDPSFEAAAFDLEIGEISDIVQSQFGYHIIKLEDKATTFEANKQEVISKIRSNSITEKLTELREKAKIEYKLELGDGETKEAEESATTSEEIKAE